MIGYLGMVLLLLAWALIMKSKVASFIISAVGSVLIVIYGYYLQALPIMILNATWFIISIYNLLKVLNKKSRG
ncbi:MAG: hypothetical protein DRP02_12380 [Candidatus Gerdarchaeota archaeon]|nr:MAG: hypothetical protein DRP02_12380 [Candidatus Gerdarchaeota archaeon]